MELGNTAQHIKTELYNTVKNKVNSVLLLSSFIRAYHYYQYMENVLTFKLQVCQRKQCNVTLFVIPSKSSAKVLVWMSYFTKPWYSFWHKLQHHQGFTLITITIYAFKYIKALPYDTVVRTWWWLSAQDLYI